MKRAKNNARCGSGDVLQAMSSESYSKVMQILHNDGVNINA